MSIAKKNVNKDSVINIWPSSIIYVFLSIISVFMMTLFILFPFFLLIENEPINFFGFGYINEGYIQFLISLPLCIFPVYIFLKSGILSYKISFTKTHIIVPKISEVQDKRLELACNEISTCEVSMEGFYYFFKFTLDNGRKRKMFITRFSFRQMEMILKMIQERGGLTDLNINEIINPLRIRKKK